MERILSSPFARYFYVIIILSMLIFGLFRYMALPYLCGTDPECVSIAFKGYSSIAELTDNLLMTLLVTVAIGSLIFWLYPRESRIASFQILQPIEIGSALEEAMIDTDFWIYKGGTGTYLKSTTLPKNAEYASKKRKTRDIMIEILDPINDEVCKAYAGYRQALAKAKKDKSLWSLVRVRNELYATILSVVVLKTEAPLLNIQIGTTRAFSSFRYDLSSQNIIITNEDPRFPAIKADRGHHFYGVYWDELKLSFDQSRKISITETPEVERKALSVESTRKIFEDLNIFHPDLTDNDLKEIVKMTKSPINPYA